METFACEARDISGKLVRKRLDAESPSAAVRLLEEEGLFPVAVEPLVARRAVKAHSEPRARRALPVGGRVDRRIRLKQRRNFSVQLASSLSAGVPILGALHAIAEEDDDQRFGAIVASICADLESGLPLSEALHKLPRAFPEVYSSTIAAGEQSGSLDEVLHRLAEQIEAEMEVRSDVRSALLYPVMVIFALMLAITVLIVFVVPRFATFYSGFQTELPLPTRILIGGSQLLGDYWFIALGCAAGLGYGLRQVLRTYAGRRAFDRLLQNAPIVGHVLETAHTLHITQLIGLFTRASVPIVQGLRIIAKTSSSLLVRERLEDVADRVARGEPLGASLAEARCLPPAARQMVAAGEFSGSLDTACETVARHYKKELRYLTKNLSTMIEPLMTLGLAVIVLFVALAVFLPMWDMVKVVQ